MGTEGHWEEEAKKSAAYQDSSKNQGPGQSGPHAELGRGRASVPANTGAGDGKESVQPAPKVGFPRVCESGSPAS